MKKPTDPSKLGFTGHDRNRLRKALNQTENARLFRRIQAVLLVAQGRSFPETSQICGLSRSNIYYLVKRYLQSHQITSLQDGDRAGRPREATRITNNRILTQLKRNPLLLGYRTNVWTVRLLAQHLSQHYQCPISAWTLYRRMKQMGLECKRPRYFFSEKDPHRAQKKGQLSAN
jgi:transposase